MEAFIVSICSAESKIRFLQKGLKFGKSDFAPLFASFAGLVFADLLKQGGLAAVAKKNEEKAQLLYDAIEGSDGFYKCPVAKPVRSLMNVPFTMRDPELEAEFLKEATAQVS